MKPLAVAAFCILAGPALAQQGVGQIPPGNVVGNPTGAAAPPMAFPIFSTANAWTAAQSFNGGIGCAITTSPLTSRCLNTSQVYATGGTTGGSFTFNNILLQEGVTGGTALVDGLALVHNIVGGNGGRQSLQIDTHIYPTSTWSALTNQFFVSNEASITAEANVGGLSTASPAGAMFAYNPECFLKSGATFWAQLTCQETDVDVEAGASVAYLAGMSIVQQATHSQHGFRQEAALVFTNFAGAAGWRCLICAGGFGTAEMPFGWPTNVANGGTYIGLLQEAGHALNGFKYGVDFLNANPVGTDLTGGLPFRSGMPLSGVQTATFEVSWFGDLFINTIQGAGTQNNGSGVLVPNAYLELKSPPTIGSEIDLGNSTDPTIIMRSTNIKVLNLAGTVGLPTTSTGGGVFVCIDNNGFLYRKATCP